MSQNLSEFSHLRQVSVLPGRFHVTPNHTDMITTVLGSCIAACIRDTQTGLGGLNHFLLPQDKNNHRPESGDSAMRYGDYAMGVLLGTLVRMGAKRENMEVKIFGGANLFKVSKNPVGSLNQTFILDFLKNEGLELAVSHLGGHHGRRIYYHPATGRVKMQLLSNAHIGDIIQEENKLSKTVRHQSDAGDIELFG